MYYETKIIDGWLWTRTHIVGHVLSPFDAR